MKLQSLVKLVLVIMLGTLSTSYIQAQSKNDVFGKDVGQSSNYNLNTEKASNAIDWDSERISKKIVFANESNHNVRYIVKMITGKGKERMWKSGYLGRKSTKLLKFQDEKTKVTSIQMLYKDGFNWKIYNLRQYNKEAKHLPQKIVFTGLSSQKPIIKAY